MYAGHDSSCLQLVTCILAMFVTMSRERLLACLVGCPTVRLLGDRLSVISQMSRWWYVALSMVS